MPRLSKPRLTTCFILLFAGGPLGGCIGRYGFPERQPVTRPDRPPPAADVAPLAVKVHGPRGQDRAFLSKLHEIGGRSVVAADAAPPSGRFVAITVTEVANSPAVQVWGTIAMITAFILPVYSTSSGWDVAFDTFVDGRPAASYRYAVREQIFVWLGLLPAVWVNLLTRSRSDAFTDAITRFVADSRNDGF